MNLESTIQTDSLSFCSHYISLNFEHPTEVKFASGTQRANDGINGWLCVGRRWCKWKGAYQRVKIVCKVPLDQRMDVIRQIYPPSPTRQKLLNIVGLLEKVYDDIKPDEKNLVDKWSTRENLTPLKEWLETMTHLASVRMALQNWDEDLTYRSFDDFGDS